MRRTDARGPLRAALAAALCAAGCSAAPAHAPIFSDGQRLVDSAGREVVLRGVNIRAADYFDAFHGQLPLPPFGADDCRVLGQDFGMNVLRLPLNWSLLEPTRGTIDRAYLHKALQLAADCASQGVFTFVDLHQDGWSKYVGADGAPFWAHDPPLPPEDIDERAGNQASTSATVQAAFDHFFANPTLLADYAAMAADVARAVDRQPGIIGLELMNEPLATTEQLATFYATVAPKVRAAAPGLPVYFEPVAERNLLDFATPDPLTVDDTVYAPHLYTGVFQGNWMVGQDDRIERSITNMVSEAEGAHAPIVITEFGNNPADATGAAWLTAAFASLDAHALSASLWLYEEWPSTCGSPVCWGLYDEAPTGAAPAYARTLRPAAVSSLARAYPRAIAGHLESFTFDAATRTLTVQLAGAAGTHVLAAPAAIYAGDVAVSCDGRATTATRRGSQVETSCAGHTLVMRPATP